MHFCIVDTKYKLLLTMSAKSLGTFPVIYDVDEQRIPLPRKTMLFEGDTNSTGGEMMSFQVAKGFGYRFNIVQRGKGAHNCYFCSVKRTGVENSYHCMGVPRTFGRHCSSMM